jgi:hypothetical protein
MKYFDLKGGISIIGVILLGIIIVVVLNYFHLKVQIVHDGTSGPQTTQTLQGSVVDLWNTYFAVPLTNIWKTYFEPLVAYIIKNMQTPPADNSSPQPN